MNTITQALKETIETFSYNKELQTKFEISVSTNNEWISITGAKEEFDNYRIELIDTITETFKNDLKYSGVDFYLDSTKSNTLSVLFKKV